MGTRTASTNISITVQQDGLTLQSQSGQSTTTQQADNVPLSTVVNLTTGNNTVTIPAKAAGVTIVPSQANTNNLVLKGASGDTGVVIQSGTMPAPFPSTSFAFAQAAMGSFVLNSGINTPITLIWQ